MTFNDGINFILKSLELITLVHEAASFSQIFVLRQTGALAKQLECPDAMLTSAINWQCDCRPITCPLWVQHPVGIQ